MAELRSDGGPGGPGRDEAPPAPPERGDERRGPAARSSEFAEAVARKERRKLRARRDERHGLAFGLGLFGLIGWSVALPALLGIALGVWIDRSWPSRFSWTLMLLVAGVALGCVNAWHWLRREGGDDDDA